MVGNFWHFGIIPPPPSDAEVLCGATQLIEQFGEQAATQALLRCQDALELGNTSSYELWQRIAIAVQELKRTKPNGDEAIISAASEQDARLSGPNYPSSWRAAGTTMRSGQPLGPPDRDW
jgi:hypothetical protein